MFSFKNNKTFNLHLINKSIEFGKIKIKIKKGEKCD